MHGYQHTAVNVTATTLLCGTLAVLNFPITAAAVGAGLLFGTLLVTPDLDLQLNDARRRWGILKFIWGPYAALSRHRGRSHTYLLGPTVRLLYLALWLAPPIILVQHFSPGMLAPRFTLNLTILFLLGYFVAQWLHLLCDGILPFAQPARRSRRRQS